MVKQFSKSIQGTYSVSYWKVWFTLSIAFLLIIYSIINISFSVNSNTLKDDAIYYGIIFICTLVFIYVKFNLSTKITIKANEILIAQNNKVSKLNISEIEYVYYDRGLSFNLNGDYVKIPEYTSLNELELFKELKSMGLNCHEHSSD